MNMQNSALNPRALERFIEKDPRSWAALKEFAVGGLLIETGLPASTLDTAFDTNVSPAQTWGILSLLSDAAPRMSLDAIEAAKTYTLIHFGCRFLETVDHPYPKATLVDATGALKVSTNTGHALAGISSGLELLYQRPSTYFSADITAAANALKEIIPGIRTEAILGFLEPRAPLRPEIRDQLKRDLCSAIGDAAASAAPPAKDGKPS